MMKSITIGLAILFFVLQYQLWFASGGLFSAWHMQRGIEKQTLVNAELKKRNDGLKLDVKDLKHDKQALEEHARNDLGMIQKDETFYQAVENGNNHNS